MRADLVVDNDIAVSSNILECQIVFEVAGTRSRSEQNKTQDSGSSKAPVTLENIFENQVHNWFLPVSQRRIHRPGLGTVECK